VFERGVVSQLGLEAFQTCEGLGVAQL
jgi:hypothetical protein